MVRAVLSYADADYHEGTIYKASNFEYYGLSDPKKDFWIKQNDGSFVKHSRGKMSGLNGEWRDRSRKHRFLMIADDHHGITVEHEIEAFDRVRAVAHHVSETDQPIDSRGVERRKHRFQREEIPVNVRDDSESHEARLS